jgi:hypothetical protein
VNKEFRELLLKCYLEWQTAPELSRWLQDLGQEPKGSIEEKKARIREHTRFLSMSPQMFVEENINHLRMLNRADIFADICQELGLDREGSKNDLFRRICRGIRYREGWAGSISKSHPEINKQTVSQFVTWYPILRWSDYEKDYYDDFVNEMIEVFGEDNVHEQFPIAHGNTLRIDFHIGHPQNGGVGVEFKLPTNKGEIDRARGQLDDYLSRYGSNLIVVLIPHLLEPKLVIPFREDLHRKGIETVVKYEHTNPGDDQLAA